MRKILRLLYFFIILCVLSVACLIAFSAHYMQTPTTRAQETNLIIRKGTSSQAIADMLAEQKIIRWPLLFFAHEYALGHTKQFKAGEYAFAATISPKEVAEKLISGEVVVHKLTIVEGWNTKEVLAALRAEPVLEGDITRAVREGSILPQTYHFTYGDTRDEVIARMQSSMQEALDAAWDKRAENLPLKNKEEALILASIVEKETGVPEERARVAAVFINRLKKGMMLQTDPTVVYGIEQEIGDKMNRALTYDDLKKSTPYNTYIITGLPPTPIANPGRESIEATLNPLQTDELYFVATGNGGHHFSSTLEQHNKNVRNYRAARKAAR